MSARVRLAGPLARDSVLTGAGALLTVGLSGIASIVVARALGPSGRGEWAAIFSLATLAGTIGALGLPAAAGFAVGRAGEHRRATAEAGLVASSALALVALLLYAAVWLTASPATTDAAAVALGGGIAAITVVQSVALQTVLVGASLRAYALAQVIPAAGALAVILAFAIAGKLSLVTVGGVYAGRAAAGALLCTAALRRVGLVRRRFTGLRPRAFATMAPYAGYALATFLTISLTTLVQRADVLLISGMLGSRPAGLYAVAVQLLELLIVLPGVLGFLLFRRGARSTPDHWTDAVRALRWAAAIQVVAASVVLVAATPIVRLLFGSAYVDSVVAIRWLMPAAVFLGLQSVISNYIAGRGRPRSVLVAWAVGAIVGIGLNVLIIPRHGIAGAAAVSSLAYAIVLALHLTALREVRRRDVAASGR